MNRGAREISARTESRAAESSGCCESNALPAASPTRWARDGVESMDKGGRLEVSIRRVNTEVVLEIADQGCGIPADVQDKIFQLYFTTKGEGTGIGLAITFQAVQMHGGSIDFESEPGRGTIFRLRLPTADQPQLAGAAD